MKFISRRFWARLCVALSNLANRYFCASLPAALQVLHQIYGGPHEAPKPARTPAPPMGPVRVLLCQLRRTCLIQIPRRLRQFLGRLLRHPPLRSLQLLYIRTPRHRPRQRRGALHQTTAWNSLLPPICHRRPLQHSYRACRRCSRVSRVLDLWKAFPVACFGWSCMERALIGREEGIFG